MKRLILILFFIFSTSSFAADLIPSDAQSIKAVGVPLFPSATFLIGSKGGGFLFATSTPLKDVRRWYRQQLPKWPLSDEFSWILYDGDPGLDLSAIMFKKNQIWVQTNKKNPGLYSLDKDMITEIMILVVK